MAIISEQVFSANGTQKQFQVAGTILSDSHVGVWIRDTVTLVEERLSTGDYDVLGSFVLINTAPAVGKDVVLVLSDNGEDLTIPPSNITTVAGSIDDVNLVADSITDVNTVAGSIANVNTSAVNIANINTVANSISNVNTVGLAISNVNTVSGSIAKVIIVSDSIGDVSTVSNSIDNVNTVGTNIAKVSTVSTSMDNVNNVSANIADINSVVANASNINTLVSNMSKITATVADIGNISIIGNDLSNDYEYIEDNGSITSSVTSGSGVSLLGILSANIDDVIGAANISSEIVTVAGSISNVNTVSDSITSINNIVSDIVNINNVAATVIPNIPEILLVATNLLDGAINSGDLGSISAPVDATSGAGSNIEIIANNMEELLLVNDNAIIASTKAADASASAVTATTKASEASTSATTATTQANLAIAAYDSFDDRYLGAKATVPTLDNDGNPLLTGAMFFDTTANKMKVYDGTVWQLAGSLVAGITEQQVYTATAGQTTFSIVYDVGFVYVYLNGVRLTSSDFTATNGTSITLNTGCTAGDIVECVSFGTFEIANVYTKAENNTLLDLKANVTDVNSALDLKANLASPAFTDTPTAPTASTGTNTTQLATTEFVTNRFKGKDICTAWVNFDGTTTPPTIGDSYNVSSVVRTADGQYDIYYTVAMDNQHYVVLGSGESHDTNNNAYATILNQADVNGVQPLDRARVTISRISDQSAFVNGYACVFVIGGKN
jgi:hypothetical protein